MSLNQIASILAFLVGIMSIVAGGKAMQGWNPGYSVLAWLPVYNFVMGILALIPVVLLWINHRFVLIASLATFGVHALVLLLLFIAFGDQVAMQSIAAMVFRLVVWIIILGLVFLQARDLNFSRLQPQSNLSGGVHIWYTGINSVLLHYIPQPDPQIWDEASETRIKFSILRNTCLRVFDSNPINDHAPLPGFSLLGSDLLTQQGDSISSRLVFIFRISLLWFCTGCKV